MKSIYLKLDAFFICYIFCEEAQISFCSAHYFLVLSSCFGYVGEYSNELNANCYRFQKTYHAIN
ncbi:hypothetical protein SAMN05661096_00042 [Marivirga sericea]|uniref:Uncharacterized protein n=1 Tax=Marivirga sericea TaxID=1028 RepID=A0A1X7HZR4_9BACT|nr:hypothetical protein SAMN05661096_00042 [Marivirga sericea]